MDNLQNHINFEHRVCFVNNIRLHYVIAGSGNPLILLHGWPQTWYEWRNIIPELSKHYTVIASDLRGSGLSDKPKTGYDKLNLAYDINSLVEQLGFKQVYLVGHDCHFT